MVFSLAYIKEKIELLSYNSDLYIIFKRDKLRFMSSLNFIFFIKIICNTRNLKIILIKLDFYIIIPQKFFEKY